MPRSAKIFIGAVVILIIIGAFAYSRRDGDATAIKIGVISPLTGDVAYWGESTAIGVKLAKEDLVKEGLRVEFLLEDGQLDPKIATNAAQKLVNTEHVDAIFAEFNSPSIAVASFLKDRPLLYLFNAAPVSPLADGEHVFKTYLDYESSCKDVAAYLQSVRNVKKIGVLKINLEYGELCIKGIRAVFGEQVAVESYNPGTKDFRTNLNKLKAAGADSIFHVSYQPETLSSLKQMNELGIKAVFAGLSETITADIVPEYKGILEGIVMFGLPKPSDGFVKRADAASAKPIGDYNAAALAYLHMKQLAGAIFSCKGDLSCQEGKLASSPVDPSLGFLGYEDRVAQFDTRIQEWKNGGFIDVE